MAIIIGTWFWGSKYPKYYVDKLKSSLSRHIKQEFNFRIFKPTSEDEYLTTIPGCFCRLRMFDPVWQESNGINKGDRLVCIDLDVVITGKLDPLLDRMDDFTIVQGVNSSGFNFNGSFWMIKAGYRPDVWYDFSVESAQNIPYHDFPDDQSWMEYKIKEAGSWGPEDGVYAFEKKGWPRNRQNRLPKNARIVVFPGWRDPSQFYDLQWIRSNWRT